MAGGRGPAADTATAISLHPTEKDQHGLPVPVVHFTDHANDFAMRNHAFKAGRAIYESLGATEVFELPPFPSTHNMGTCRQSENPRDGVCNSYGQAHDIPNLFISDGSQFTASGGGEPDPDDRGAGDPAGGIYRRPAGQTADVGPGGQTLVPRASPLAGSGQSPDLAVRHQIARGMISGSQDPGCRKSCTIRWSADRRPVQAARWAKSDTALPDVGQRDPLR